eukprot:Em0015g968a
MAELPPPYDVALQQSRPAPVMTFERNPPAPSAPPLEAQRGWQGYGTVTAAAPPVLGISTTAPIPAAADHKGMVESYVSYSIPAKLYSQSCGHHRNENPGNLMSCCISSCLCCCGAVLVAAFLLLPVAMIITSLLSYNFCTSSTISRLLPRYLGVGGGLLGLLVCFRTITSILTCCRNRGRGGSAPRYQSKVCICLFEIFVALCVIANLALLGVASYFMFKNLPHGMNYCPEQHRNYYYVTVSYMFLQYLLYVLSCLFCCLSYCSQRAFQ